VGGNIKILVVHRDAADAIMLGRRNFSNFDNLTLGIAFRVDDPFKGMALTRLRNGEREAKERDAESGYALVKKALMACMRRPVNRLAERGAE
jgi:hypothetical protein